MTVSAPTEERHPGTGGLDAMTTLEVLPHAQRRGRPRGAGRRRGAARAGRGSSTSPSTASAAGGTVHYFGAGTSGRLAVLDAAELLPTFNAPAGLFVAHHAGGPAALVAAVENVEDDAELGGPRRRGRRPGDVVVGLTASGRTPYVAGALARRPGARRADAAGDRQPAGRAGRCADVLLAVDTGPEVITGSTRLKAGTAQKLVLNGVLDGGHGPARPDLVQPHGRRGRRPTPSCAAG